MENILPSDKVLFHRTAKIATGSVSTSANVARTVDVGFQPKLISIIKDGESASWYMTYNGFSASDSTYRGGAKTGFPTSSNNYIQSVSSTGFTFKTESSATYYYVAVTN